MIKIPKITIFYRWLSAIRFFVWLKIFGILTSACHSNQNLEPQSLTKGDLDQKCDQDLPLNCWINVIQHLPIQQVLRLKVVNRTLKRSVHDELVFRAKKSAPQAIINNFDFTKAKDLKVLAQMERDLVDQYLSSYARLLNKDWGSPNLSIVAKFCSLGMGHAGCKYLIPLNKWGIMAIGAMNQIAVMPVTSSKIAPSPTFFSLKSITKFNEFTSLSIDANYQSSSSAPFEFLLYVAGLKGQVVKKFLLKVEVGLEGRVSVTGILEVPETEPDFQRFSKILVIGEHYVLAKFDQLIIGNVKEFKISSEQKIANLVDIGPYDRDHFYVKTRDSDQYLLLNPQHPESRLRVSALTYESQAQSAFVKECGGSRIKAIGMDQMTVEINNGILTASFTSVGKLTKEMQLPDMNKYFSHLVQISPGIWGAMNITGDLILVNAWQPE